MADQTYYPEETQETHEGMGGRRLWAMILNTEVDPRTF
jgi:hypothetical protein